jgi:hypothetical protein
VIPVLILAFLLLGVLAASPADAASRRPVVVEPARPAPLPTDALADDLPYWPAPDPRESPIALTDESEATLSLGSLSLLPEFQLATSLLAGVPVPAPILTLFRASGPAPISSDEILNNARNLLGVRYVWGGNTSSGMDCSAYVSRTWGVSRQTTDTLHTVAYAISKDELIPGDALNLTRSQDPRGFGHVRLFAGWGNPEHTRMWVYEETPPQAIYHVITYDPRYTPMRRFNLNADGVGRAPAGQPLRGRRR